MADNGVRKRQSNNGHSNNQCVQDAALDTAHTLIGDPNIAANPDLRMGLSNQIPHSTNVHWHSSEDGATQPMTLAKARNFVKLGKNTKNSKIAVSMAKTPPPDLNFYQNKKQRQIEPLPD